MKIKDEIISKITIYLLGVTGGVSVYIASEGHNRYIIPGAFISILIINVIDVVIDIIIEILRMKDETKN